MVGKIDTFPSWLDYNENSTQKEFQVLKFIAKEEHGTVQFVIRTLCPN